MLLVECVKSGGKAARNLRMALFKFYSQAVREAYRGHKSGERSRFMVAMLRRNSFGGCDEEVSKALVALPTRCGKRTIDRALVPHFAMTQSYRCRALAET